MTTSFISYATEVSGSSYLQFATLKEVEVFERSDEASALWGRIDLPDVIVQATAPVDYTYHLDLDGTWQLVLEGETIQVLAPRNRYNTPAWSASSRGAARANAPLTPERGVMSCRCFKGPACRRLAHSIGDQNGAPIFVSVFTRWPQTCLSHCRSVTRAFREPLARQLAVSPRVRHERTRT